MNTHHLPPVPPPPEVKQLHDFLAAFNAESDRGAALVAASMLDERLQEILSTFFVKSHEASDLLAGFNAPLGTFSSRASAAFALGLVQKNEFKEITLIRKIRNEFGHGWEPMSFSSDRIAGFTRQLPWLGPAEYEATSTLRARFNFAVSMLLTDLIWRVRLVEQEKRTCKVWPNKVREG
jgi:DNA-binding MltR family transcriptional regulator